MRVLARRRAGDDGSARDASRASLGGDNEAVSSASLEGNGLVSPKCVSFIVFSAEVREKKRMEARREIEEEGGSRRTE